MSFGSARIHLMFQQLAKFRSSRRPVIGFLSAESRDLFTDRLRVFLKGLSESGYGVGQNVAIEFRWAAG